MKRRLRLCQCPRLYRWQRRIECLRAPSSLMPGSCYSPAPSGGRKSDAPTVEKLRPAVLIGIADLRLVELLHIFGRAHAYDHVKHFGLCTVPIVICGRMGHQVVLMSCESAGRGTDSFELGRGIGWPLGAVEILLPIRHFHPHEIADGVEAIHCGH